MSSIVYVHSHPIRFISNWLGQSFVVLKML